MIKKKYIIVGLGNIGKKRQNVLGDNCVATVDPFNDKADYKSISEVPTDTYDCAVLSIPNEKKLEYIEYFLSKGKSVLVDKPLIFESDEQADKLKALAMTNQTIWQTSYNHRFEELILKLKEPLDEGKLGEIYNARLFYGNGTVQNQVGTWRETGDGIIEDLGCHLIDLSNWLFNLNNPEFILYNSSKTELKTYDYCLFGSADKKITFECSFLCWKNTFTIDVYGEKGSLHLNNLCKWGESSLVLRERIFPSGVPTETVWKTNKADDSWALDMENFESNIINQKTGCDRDIFITKGLGVLTK